MNNSPMSMPRPTSHTTPQLPSLRRRTIPLFPEVAARRMENSAVVWLPYPEREKKEETEFVIVTQCSFKCKKNFETKKKKKEKIESSYISFSCCIHFTVIMYFMP